MTNPTTTTATCGSNTIKYTITTIITICILTHSTCTTSTNAAETEEESWLLAARFLD